MCAVRALRQVLPLRLRWTVDDFLYHLYGMHLAVWAECMVAYQNECDDTRCMCFS